MLRKATYYCYAGCRCAEWHYVKCYYAERRGA